METLKIPVTYAALQCRKGRSVNTSQDPRLLRATMFLYHTGSTNAMTECGFLLYRSLLCQYKYKAFCRTTVLHCICNARATFTQVHSCPLPRLSLGLDGTIYDELAEASCQWGHLTFDVWTLTSFFPVPIQSKMLLIREMTLGQWFASSSKHPTFPVER